MAPLRGVGGPQSLGLRLSSAGFAIVERWSALLRRLRSKPEGRPDITPLDGGQTCIAPFTYVPR
jgi:hypothetical protein